jgi:hypothetical protein
MKLVAVNMAQANSPFFPHEPPFQLPLPGELYPPAPGSASDIQRFPNVAAYPGHLAIHKIEQRSPNEINPA